MKLLICTQAVDSMDTVLGFFHRWIEEFAKHCEEVTVICLREGVHSLPPNVRVLALGAGNRVARAMRLLRHAISLRHEYDAVFVHMNPEYILTAGFLWRLWRKKVALWYAHKSVPLKLRMALPFVDSVVTSSVSGFRLPTKKLHVLGQGIDTALFSCHTKQTSGVLRVLTVGRISKVKAVDCMLDVADILRVRQVPFVLTIAGVPLTSADTAYAEALYKRAGNHVHFLGPKTQREVAVLLCESDVFLNLGGTGSMDKAVLEALSAGVPVVTSNEAFVEMLKPLGLFVGDKVETIAEAIIRAPQVNIAPLVEEVRTRYALQSLVPNILKQLGLSC